MSKNIYKVTPLKEDLLILTFFLEKSFFDSNMGFSITSLKDNREILTYKLPKARITFGCCVVTSIILKKELYLYAYGKYTDDTSYIYIDIFDIDKEVKFLSSFSIPMEYSFSNVEGRLYQLSDNTITLAWSDLVNYNYINYWCCSSIDALIFCKETLSYFTSKKILNVEEFVDYNKYIFISEECIIYTDILLLKNNSFILFGTDAFTTENGYYFEILIEDFPYNYLSSGEEIETKILNFGLKRTLIRVKFFSMKDDLTLEEYYIFFLINIQDKKLVSMSEKILCSEELHPYIKDEKLVVY